MNRLTSLTGIMAIFAWVPLTCAEMYRQGAPFLPRDASMTGAPLNSSQWFHGQAPLINLPTFDLPTHYGNGSNTYQFVRSNPVNWRDPLGLSIDEDVDEFIGDYTSNLRATSNFLDFLQSEIARGHQLSMAYTRGAFAWDDFVWSRDEDILFGLAFGGFFAGACFEAGTSVLMADGSMKAIEQVCVGDRVATRTDGAFRKAPFPPRDPPEMHTIALEAENAYCSTVRASLLRSANWIAEIDAAVGRSIALNIPEMGVRGVGRVVSIDPGSARGAGAEGGQVVTGVFVTQDVPIVDVYLEGLASPIGTTTTHPFFSLDLGEWVPAGLLHDGERVATLDGGVFVQAVHDRKTAVTVYNLEVKDAHTFFVSETQVLVHNACVQPGGRAWSKLERSPANSRRLSRGELSANFHSIKRGSRLGPRQRTLVDDLTGDVYNNTEGSDELGEWIGNVFGR